jgi:hypothetical protein
VSGERLTRQEAFNLVGSAVAALTSGDRAVPASRVREQAFKILGRDSESLSERNFIRILKDAHDGDVVDLRRRGDDYEVAVAAQVAPVADQLNKAAAAMAPAPRTTTAPPVPRGMGPRGAGVRGRGPAGRGSAPPPDLLLLGVVDEPAAPPATTITASLSPVQETGAATEVEAPVSVVEDTADAPKRGRGRKRPAAKKAAAKAPRAAAAPAPVAAPAAPAAPVAKSRRGRGKKKAVAAAVEG